MSDRDTGRRERHESFSPFPQLLATNVPVLAFTQTRGNSKISWPFGKGVLGVVVVLFFCFLSLAYPGKTGVSLRVLTVTYSPGSFLPSPPANFFLRRSSSSSTGAIDGRFLAYCVLGRVHRQSHSYVIKTTVVGHYCRCGSYAGGGV